jgi:hypothetical protein
MTSFDRVAATFWHPGNDNLTLPPLTDRRLAQAQAELGVTLPAELVHLLRLRNGGVVADDWDACPAAPNSWAPDHVPFDHLMGIAPPGHDTLSMLDTAYLVAEWDLPSPIVLLSGDGHTWTALTTAPAARPAPHRWSGSPPTWTRTCRSPPTSAVSWNVSPRRPSTPTTRQTAGRDGCTRDPKRGHRPGTCPTLTP